MLGSCNPKLLLGHQCDTFKSTAQQTGPTPPPRHEKRVGAQRKTRGTVNFDCRPRVIHGGQSRSPRCTTAMNLHGPQDHEDDPRHRGTSPFVSFRHGKPPLVAVSVRNPKKKRHHERGRPDRYTDDPALNFLRERGRHQPRCSSEKRSKQNANRGGGNPATDKVIETVVGVPRGVRSPCLCKRAGVGSGLCRPMRACLFCHSDSRSEELVSEGVRERMKGRRAPGVPAS